MLKRTNGEKTFCFSTTFIVSQKKRKLLQILFRMQQRLVTFPLFIIFFGVAMHVVEANISSDFWLRLICSYLWHAIKIWVKMAKTHVYTLCHIFFNTDLSKVKNCTSNNINQNKKKTTNLKILNCYIEYKIKVFFYDCQMCIYVSLYAFICDCDVCLGVWVSIFVEQSAYIT